MSIRNLTVWHVMSRVSLGTLALASSPALSQTQSSEPPVAGAQSQDDGSIADIVVTAQRREQRLIEVPISVQAIGGQLLTRAVAITTNDLIKLAPSVNFVGGSSPANSSVAIRGIASIAQEGGVQPSTAVIVDEVPVSRQGEFISDFGDIERVEVLRGPQGTLFGKNATAGVINIVNKRPNDRYEGTIEGGYTTDDEKLIRGVVNIPFSDAARLRINAFWRDRDSLLDNVAALVQSSNYDKTGGDTSYGVAGKLALDITDTVDLLLSADASYNRSGMGANLILVGNTNPAFRAPQVAANVIVDRNRPHLSSDSGADSISKMWGVSGNLTVKLNESLTFRSITAYRTYRNDFVTDADSGPWGAWRGVGFVGEQFGYPTFYVMEANGGLPRAPGKTSYFSEEARFNYSVDGLDLVAGGFVQLLKDTKHNSVPLVTTNALGVRNFSDTVVDAAVYDDVYSIFADATYRVADGVFAFGGLRYSIEKLRVDYRRVAFSTPNFNPVTFVPNDPGTLSQNNESITTKNLSGRLGLRFEPESGHSYYVSASRGYKGPAADISRAAALPTIMNPNVSQFLKPEIATAFEVGTKHDLFGRRANLNVSVFYQETKNIQQSALIPGGITSRLQNAGDIVSYGAEAEFTARVTDAFRLSGALSYAHAEYRRLQNANYPGQPGNDPRCVAVNATTGFCTRQDLAGTQAFGSPRYAGNISADYDFSLPETLPFNSFVRLAYTYTGTIQHGLTADPLLREPAHGSLEATLGLVGKKDEWQILFYGRNLTNEVFYSRLGAADNFIGRAFGSVTRDVKRYGGVQFRASF